MEDIKDKLIQAGLSNKEADVYISLLQNSPISGGELSKHLNMDRTHTYNLLNNLVNKGLVSHIIKDNKRLFIASSPENLLNQVQKRERIILDLLPSLKQLVTYKKENPQVKILEGKAGLRTLMRMLFESGDKDICVYGGTGKSYESLKFEMPRITRETQEKHINGRIITGEKLRGQLFTKLRNFNIKYIDELTPSSTMIFGDKISINVFGEKPFVIIIESKPISKSYREYFEYLWRIARK